LEKNPIARKVSKFAGKSQAFLVVAFPRLQFHTAAMLKLSGFADEISPELDQQIATCRRAGVTHFELRGVEGKNVLAFDKPMAARVKSALDAAGLGVISIGSPCGKKPVDTPRQELMDMFKTALDMAVHFKAPFIRVFSFYPPGGEGKGPVEPIRNQVIDLLHAQCELLAGTDVVMVHENEKGIFGDIGPRCVDLMTTINHPKLRTAFDFANFVQCGQDPLAAWPALKPFTAHIHIKDAVAATGRVVPAGDGDGHIPAILADAFAGGYRGFLSLEPHLKVAGHSTGETGPELFELAVAKLRAVCKSVGVPLAS
jgi:3-dehydroshikimate dehydratase